MSALQGREPTLSDRFLPFLLLSLVCLSVAVVFVFSTARLE